MKQSKKQRQIGTLIQNEFSRVLQLKGSYIYGDALVTVTNVRMSSDLGIAYIYLSVYNTMYKQEVIKMMWENVQHLRGELGHRIRKQVRRVPMIKFYIDDTLDEIDRVNNLFNKIETENNSIRSMKDVLRERAEREAQKAKEENNDAE